MASPKVAQARREAQEAKAGAVKEWGKVKTEFKTKYKESKGLIGEAWQRHKQASKEKREREETIRKVRRGVYEKELQAEHLRLAKKKARLDARKTAFGGMFQKHTPKGSKISIGQSRDWLASMAGSPPSLSSGKTKERRKPPSMEDFFL